MKERTRCPKCGKFLTPYIKGSDLCQACYRELLENYSFYKYKNEDKLPQKGSTMEKICNLFFTTAKSGVEIAYELGLSKVYVSQVKKKYLVKCDCYGNPIPEYMR